MVISSQGVHAARPFITDDARIVERGGCQIETLYEVVFDLAYHGKSTCTLPVHGRTQAWGGRKED